jgi:hypothetical protein
VAKTLVASILIVRFYLKEIHMKIKSLIALAALAPTLVLAQVIGNPNSSQAKPPVMPPAQTAPPPQMGKMGDAEQRKPITPGNANTSNPSQSSIINKETSTNTGSKKSADPTSVGIPSDQRLKRDIHQFTSMPNGIKLYSFKYLWSDDVYVGVMAQDLLSNAQWKDAVITSNTGYYKVDYSKLGIQMMTLGQYELQQQQSNVALAN